MHSIILGISTNKYNEDFLNEDEVCDLFEFPDWVSEMDTNIDKNIEDALKLIKEIVEYVDINIDRKYFKFDKNQLELIRENMHKERKDSILTILNSNDRLSELDYYQISKIAEPKYGVLIMLENYEFDGHIDDFIMFHAEDKKYYIRKLYDYHF